MLEQSSLIVELRGQGISGWGEVTQNRYYKRTIESLDKSVRAATDLLPAIERDKPEQVWPTLMDALDEDTFAVSALDMAAHDWHARRQGVQTWQMWGLQWQQVPKSSFTIAIDSIEGMLARLHEQPDWPIYKIKLGTSNVLEIVRHLRAATQATLRVDANCAWTAEQTVEYSKYLRDLGVQFIEQPLPREASIAEQRKVFEESQIPIIADESCQTEDDVNRCFGHFHGINIKICKCGGLTPALRMLGQARLMGMKTMVGCMVESSIGISAAAQLLPLLDYADLDGSALLAYDPTEGVRVSGDGIRLTTALGHGACLTQTDNTADYEQKNHRTLI